MQRRVHVEMAPPRFCRYFTWARDRACFFAHSTVNFCAYIARTSEIGHFQAWAKGAISYRFFAWSRPNFWFPKKSQNQKTSIFTMIPVGHAHFFGARFFTKSHFLSIFCVRTLFSKKAIFCRYLQCFSKMGIREIFWGHFGNFGDLFFEFFVDILRVHALFQVFRKKRKSRFGR